MTKLEIETRISTLKLEIKELERQLMYEACSASAARIKAHAIKEKLEEIDLLNDQLNTL